MARKRAVNIPDKPDPIEEYGTQELTGELVRRHTEACLLRDKYRAFAQQLTVMRPKTDAEWERMINAAATLGLDI